MTAQIHKFRLRPEFAALLEARQNRADIVAAARAILRSPAAHSDAILHEACVALTTWGDGADWLEADAMTYAIALRQRRERHEAARLAVSRREAPTGRIRRALGVLAGAVAFAAVSWAGIAGVML